MSRDFRPTPSGNRGPDVRINVSRGGPSPFGLMVLGGMQHKPMYQGTVDPAVVRRRRAKNKAAGKSRRANRRAA